MEELNLFCSGRRVDQALRVGGEVADEGGGGGVEDGDGGVVAGVEVAGGEDAHLAGGGASGEHGGIALGGAFDEDFEGFADVPAVAFEGLAVLEVDDF